MATPTYDPSSNPFSAGDDFPSTDGSVTLPGGVTGVTVDYSFQATAEFGNQVITSWNGTEKRSSKVAMRRRFKLSFEQLTPGDSDTLWNHFLAQSGDLYAFAYYDYQSGESFTVRYAKGNYTRETFLYDAEKSSIELIEVL